MKYLLIKHSAAHLPFVYSNILFYLFRSLYYFDENENELCFEVRNHPMEIRNKVNLFQSFQKYMDRYLVNATKIHEKSYNEIPFVNLWYTTDCAVVIHLTNGTVQVNYPLLTDD